MFLFHTIEFHFTPFLHTVFLFCIPAILGEASGGSEGLRPGRHRVQLNGAASWAQASGSSCHGGDHPAVCGYGPTCLHTASNRTDWLSLSPRAQPWCLPEPRAAPSSGTKPPGLSLRI